MRHVWVVSVVLSFARAKYWRQPNSRALDKYSMAHLQMKPCTLTQNNLNLPGRTC